MQRNSARGAHATIPAAATWTPLDSSQALCTAGLPRSITRTALRQTQSLGKVAYLAFASCPVY